MTDQDDLTVVRVAEFLPHPPDRVWHALVDPEALNTWFLPTDFKPVVGHRFTFRADPVPATGFSGVVAGEVLDVRAAELISYTWADADNPDGLDTVVTWTLHPEGTGTRLFIEQRGFDPDDPLQQMVRTILGGGWRTRVLRRLAAHLTSEGRAE